MGELQAGARNAFAQQRVARQKAAGEHEALDEIGVGAIHREARVGDGDGLDHRPPGRLQRARKRLEIERQVGFADRLAHLDRDDAVVGALERRDNPSARHGRGRPRPRASAARARVRPARARWSRRRARRRRIARAAPPRRPSRSRSRARSRRRRGRAVLRCGRVSAPAPPPGSRPRRRRSPRNSSSTGRARARRRRCRGRNAP